MYHQFNIQQFYVLPTQCICLFCVDLRTNSDYFPIQHQFTGFCNRDEVCLLRGTDWTIYVPFRLKPDVQLIATTHKPIPSRTLHHLPTVCSIISGGGGLALKFGSSERSRVGWPEIAATFGVGGLPAGGPSHIISRTVKLFGQGEGDARKSADIWRQAYEPNSRLWGLTVSATASLLAVRRPLATETTSSTPCVCQYYF